MPISLRAQDINFLEEEFAAGQFRAVNGFNNNLAHPLWGNSDRAFVRLSPAQYEIATVNGVRVTGASGSPLPNERLVSNVVSQGTDGNGLSIDMPTTAGTNLLLMSFGQFFDHGLDFFARGGGSQFVDMSNIDAQLEQIAADNPGLNIDVTDNIIAQGVPPQLQFLIGGRGARYTTDGAGNSVLDNVNGVDHVNKISPFVDQNQTYGSTPGMAFLLRETARDANGDVVRDSGGNLVKTHRLLDGPAEIGPDGVSRGNLPTYADVLLNNGVSAADLDAALAQAAVAGGDFAGWTSLAAAAGFVGFGDIGDGTGAILIGDKNDFNTSPLDRFGNPDPNFSLEALLSYYVAGDHRPNENVALTAVHTVWHREHNFQADALAVLYPGWTAEAIFQAAKAITVAEYQRVVFDEFAEKMSGTLPGAGDHGFDGYDSSANPAISEEFAGAMYRVGHSMINETIPFVDANGVLQEVSLIDAFLNPAMFAGGDANHPEVPAGAAGLMAGLGRVAHQQIDAVIVEAVRSALLGLPLDLGAANLMRGRELGLPSLNEFRAYISGSGSSLAQAGQDSDYTTEAGIPVLAAYANWDEFGAALRGDAAERAELLARFKAVYGEDVIDPGNGLLNGTGISHVNDVDLWIGGLAEASFGASQMGSTFTWIFQEQLDRLQDGDRFYYINQFDGTLLLRDIDSEHFSDVIMRNTGLTRLHWDTFETYETRTLAAGVTNRNFSDENSSPVELVLVGNALNNVITGTDSNDTIFGGDGDDTLNGGGGKDALHGEGGNDVLNASVNAQDAFLYGEAGDDVLNGAENDDNLSGGDGNDIIRGGDGKDFLTGGAGDDWLTPGTGDDDAADGGAGIDTVDYSASTAGITLNLSIPAGRTLPDEGQGGDAQGDVIVNVENVLGSAFIDQITGDGASNLIEGAAGADILAGGGAADTASYRTSNAGVTINLVVGTGFGGHAQGDVLSGFENLLGSAFNDSLTATNDANIIDGGAGADEMIGGGGGDRYYVDNAGDTAVETTGGGSDVVYASASWTLAAGSDIEQIRATYLAGPGITLTGNELANLMIGGASGDTLNGAGGADVLLGMAGNDVLNGGAGVNTLMGGQGDDLYVVAGADTIVEVAGEGTDTIATSQISRTLGANIENLTYTGAGAFTGVGNTVANVITGGAGADTLSGRGGNDSLIGGGGSDIASFAAAAGAVIASLVLQSASNDGDGGADTFSSIENLTGSAFGDQLTGDNGANALVGGAGDDLLAGLGGDDYLSGGAGIDTVTYAGAAGGVTVKLNGARTTVDGDGGVDTLSSLENVIGSALADLLIGGATANALTGGAGGDTLVGLEGDDVLSGGTGAANTLQGGIGNDRYIVGANDTIVELAGQGVDTVETTNASHTLRANVENLAYTGAGNFSGIGNALANVITSGAGADTLTGGQGNDSLNGGGGADIAVLSGLQANYSVVAVAGGYQVTDSVAGRDGVDTLLGIEQVRFSNGSTVLLSSLAAAPSPTLSAKEADQAQVLPGLAEVKSAETGPLVLPGADDFILKGDELPLVLPGYDPLKDVFGPQVLPGESAAEVAWASRSEVRDGDVQLTLYEDMFGRAVAHKGFDDDWSF